MSPLLGAGIKVYEHEIIDIVIEKSAYSDRQRLHIRRCQLYLIAYIYVHHSRKITVNYRFVFPGVAEFFSVAFKIDKLGYPLSVACRQGDALCYAVCLNIGTRTVKEN